MTPKPQANGLDEILDKIECYMWDEDDEPTIDATTLLTAKQQIQALITEARVEQIMQDELSLMDTELPEEEIIQWRLDRLTQLKENW